MTTRVASRRRLPRPASVLARLQIAPGFATRRPSWPAPRELFGESLPELFLVAAVVAAVVSAVLTLNGVG
jgi:hypothetical protein